MQDLGLEVAMNLAVYWDVTIPGLIKVSTFRINLFFFFKLGGGSSNPLGNVCNFLPD
jgi:hypothetical protein